MKKLLTGLILIFSISVQAQKPEYIHIHPDDSVTISKSVFDSVEVIDTRPDTAKMGFVQRGMLNRKAPVMLEESMEMEIKNFSAKTIKTAAKQHHTILINIRLFHLSELTAITGETGTFIFKAGCYIKNGSLYQLMFSVDTAMTVRAFDVTDKLLNTVNNCFNTFLKKAASFSRIDSLDTPAWSFRDIENIDAKEREIIPVYNVQIPRKGLYATYNDFKQNIPSDTNFLEKLSKKGTKPSFWILDSAGQIKEQLQPKYYYAVCDGNRLFFCNEYGIYPAIKRNNDFYFGGKGKEEEATNSTSVAMASVMFGMIGGIAASAHKKTFFEFKVDHITGKFIPVKKISRYDPIYK